MFIIVIFITSPSLSSSSFHLQRTRKNLIPFSSRLSQTSSSLIVLFDGRRGVNIVSIFYLQAQPFLPFTTVALKLFAVSFDCFPDLSVARHLLFFNPNRE